MYAGVPPQFPQQTWQMIWACWTPWTARLKASIAQGSKKYGQVNSSSWMKSIPIASTSRMSSLIAAARAIARSRGSS